MGDIMRTHKY